MDHTTVRSFPASSGADYPLTNKQYELLKELFHEFNDAFHQLNDDILGAYYRRLYQGK